MRKLILGAVLALALPAAALADEGAASPERLASTACKTEKAQMGTKQFKLTYGGAKSTAKAMKACLAKQGVVAETTIKNAAHECKAELAAKGEQAFVEAYAQAGTNHNGRNAYGKCVSTKAKAASREATAARVSAADTCSNMKTTQKAAFEAAFGTSRNAFGKCVSKTAKETAGS